MILSMPLAHAEVMPINMPKHKTAKLLRTLQENLEEGVYDDLPLDEKGKQSCRANYLRLLDSGLTTIKRSHFIKRLQSPGVVVFGDYHPLFESKAAFLSILEKMEEPPLLALGCLRAWRGAPRQIKNPEELLTDRALDWPFPKEHWTPILAHAAHKELPIVGLRGKGEERLSEEERYELWTKRLKRAQKLHGGPVFAVVGEINCAYENLPKRIAKAHIAGSVSAVLLAPANVYWRLLAKGEDPCLLVAQMKNGIHAIAPSHPLRRVNAYLAWQADEPELQLPPALAWKPNSIDDNPLPALSQRISSFFGASNLFSAPKIYLPRNSTEIDELLETLSLPERKALLEKLCANESYCSPNGDYIYLARLTLSHLGEEMTHALHLKLSPPNEQGFSFADHYYHHVLREAVGFMGSKIINPKRAHPSEDELLWLAEDIFSAKGVAAQLALSLIEEEEQGHFSVPQEIPSQEVLNALVHMMGYRLGERLWSQKEASHKARSLIRRPLQKRGQARTLYIDLVSQ